MTALTGIEARYWVLAKIADAARPGSRANSHPHYAVRRKGETCGLLSIPRMLLTNDLHGILIGEAHDDGWTYDRHSYSPFTDGAQW